MQNSFKPLSYSPERQSFSIINNLETPNLQLCPVDLYTAETAQNIVSYVTQELKKGVICETLPAKEKLNALDLLTSINNKAISKITRSISGAKILDIVESVVLKLSTKFFLFNPEALRFEKFELTPEEIELWGIKSSTYLHCHDYVFYMTNELNTLLERKTFKYGFHTIYNKLKEWNYKCVLEPKPGDIVLYFNSKDKLKHLGLWTTAEKVRSKFGRAHVYEHPIDYIPDIYGDRVRFLRHKFPSPFARYCLREIKLAAKSINNFNHFATKSPLTTYGSARLLIKAFKEKKMRNLYLKSLYNKDYTSKLKKRFLDKLRPISKNEIKFQDNLALFKKIKSLLFEAQLEIKPNI